MQSLSAQNDVQPAYVPAQEQVLEADSMARRSFSGGTLVRVENGMTLTKSEYIEVAHISPVSGYSAVCVMVDGEVQYGLFAQGTTVQQVLAFYGQNVDPLDVLNCSAAQAIENGMFIRLHNTCTVTLCVYGSPYTVQANGITAAQLLSQQEIVLTEQDVLSCSPDTVLTDGATICVDRVEYRDYTVQESIPFETVTVTDNTRYVGDDGVQTQGAEGSCSVQMRDTVVNGVVTASQELSREVTLQPITCVYAVGSKERPVQSTDASGNVFSYTSVLTGTGTAYYTKGTTSTGLTSQVGVVAVNPAVIPYGTRLYITSADGRFVYGYCIAGDTGGAALQNTILADLFYDTEWECIQFGRREIVVYVLG